MLATIIKHILGTKLRVRKTFTILKGNLKVICTDGIRTHDPLKTRPVRYPYTNTASYASQTILSYYNIVNIIMGLIQINRLISLHIQTCSIQCSDIIESAEQHMFIVYACLSACISYNIWH